MTSSLTGDGVFYFRGGLNIERDPGIAGIQQ